MSVLYADYAGTDDTFDVDTVMLIETGVLDCHESVLQIFWNHVDGDRNSVGIRRHQFRSLLSFDIVYKSRKTGRGNVDVTDIRRRGEHPSEHTDSGTQSDDAYAD